MSETTHGASIELRNIVKKFRSVTALNGISLDLPAGEFVTLLGPSGSGKTTTLQMIAGFLQPDEGHVLVDGAPIETVPPHKRNIGMVFQNYALFPHMTVFANVAFPLKRRKVKTQELNKRVYEALELVGLGPLAARYPRELSGGQQQRVALARAIVFNPRILLMDEPLGALDRRLRGTLQLEFKRIHEELGITFVYVTHDQDEALVMSDRIAVFNNGNIEQVGSAEELYENPQTLYVAEFLGDSNVLPGTIVSDSFGQKHLKGDFYELALPEKENFADGDSRVVVMRPERLRISRSSENGIPSDNNVLTGHIRDVVYMGGIRRLHVALAPNVDVVVQEQAGAASKVAAGEEVKVSWAREDSVVLPDTQDQTHVGAITGSGS